MNIGRATGLLA